jgi:hypothetical protein
MELSVAYYHYPVSLKRPRSTTSATLVSVYNDLLPLLGLAAVLIVTSGFRASLHGAGKIQAWLKRPIFKGCAF